MENHEHKYNFVPFEENPGDRDYYDYYEIEVSPWILFMRNYSFL